MPEGKTPLRRPRRRWEGNIEMDLREVGYDDRDWINLAQDMDQWRAYVRAAMNLRFLKGSVHSCAPHQSDKVRRLPKLGKPSLLYSARKLQAVFHFHGGAFSLRPWCVELMVLGSNLALDIDIVSAKPFDGCPTAYLLSSEPLKGLGAFRTQWEAFLQDINVCRLLLDENNPYIAATRNLQDEIDLSISRLPLQPDQVNDFPPKCFRRTLREDSFKKWSELPGKGKSVSFNSHWKKGNAWISNKKGLSCSQWTEEIKMSCKVIPGRSLGTAHCRRCDEQETLAHVLGFRRKGELLRIDRHNEIRSMIVNELRRAGKYEVYEEIGCLSADDSTRRADIIVIDRIKNCGLILDPTVRFENSEEQPREVCKENGQFICHAAVIWGPNITSRHGTL
ncbi:hypothetical protein ANN_12171 [Periplaneta americana]|uniref:Uncharacterized protein n=1 Tax=Periplaneta americana TaxID=6978 RepID=A0ABQ8T724_PERAM|nr:hypothetical protein ANN_12171 [Periplaneta americana]